MYSLMQKPRLTVCHGRFSRAASDPSTHRSSKSEYHMRPTLSPFRLYNLPASPFLSAKLQTVWFIVGQAQCLKAPICLRTCSNARFQTNSGYLEADFDTVDLLPQNLVSADVLRESSQSRDSELRAVDRFDGKNLFKGGSRETLA